MIELLVSPLVKKLDDFIRRNFFLERREDLLSLRNSLEKLKLCSVKSVPEGKSEDGVRLEVVVHHVNKVDDFIDKLILEFDKSRSGTKATFSGRGKFPVNITGDFDNLFIDSKAVPLKPKLDKFHNKKILQVQINGFETAKPYFEFQTKTVNPKFSIGVRDQFVVGLVGIGGLWRTAMVHAMLESLSGKFHKPFFAWVHVSEYYEIHNLLLAVIKSFNMHSTPRDEELDMMGTEELGLYLYESLMERPYLLVLDDLSDLEAWAHLRRALPDNKLGSKVFITTHVRSLIDESGGESRPLYELPFSNFTIPSFPEICSTFASSFDDLHHFLKLCYLYLSIFPENFEIKVDKLIRLWVAEGFIRSGKGSTLEEVAMDYVNELADRSLIEIVKKNATRIATCRVHPCFRDLIVRKSGELKLIHAFNDQNISSNTDGKRLASHGFRKDFQQHDLARTLMIFSKETDTVAKVSNVAPFMKLTLLQVLDLEGTWFPASRKEKGKTSLPDPIGNLILLRFLGLNDTYIDDIPPFIKNLQALQTLYVDRDILVSIPNEINELKQLRYLYGRLKWPFKVNNLSQLQTLGRIEIIYRRPSFTDLVMLRELYLVFTSNRRIFITEVIDELTTLQTLYIKINGPVNLKPHLRCQNLLQLKLISKIEDLPSNMHEIFPNLKYLNISHYRKETSHPLGNLSLGILSKLPKLTILDLYHLSIEDFNEGGSFPQLETLQLINCTFKDSSFDETTMPLLKELRITVRDHQTISDRLKSLPEPRHWGRRNDDDWPYFHRTIQ